MLKITSCKITFTLCKDKILHFLSFSVTFSYMWMIITLGCPSSEKRKNCPIGLKYLSTSYILYCRMLHIDLTVSHTLHKFNSKMCY